MNKKAFTLVELIVVITILAILSTIAFISFSGFNNDAKNAKVENDLRSIGGALEVVRTRDNLRFIDAVTNINTYNEIAPASLINGGTSTVSSTGATYLVGNIDFQKLKQNGEGFKDPNSFDGKQDYIYAAIVHEDFSYSEFAGQIIEDDVKKAQLKGSYTIIDSSQDATSLISSRANDVPLEDKQEFVGDLYQ